LQVKHNTQRSLTHIAVYAIHDALRDGRVVLRLIQMNHYQRKSYHVQGRRTQNTDLPFPFKLASRTSDLKLHYLMLARSPKPPRTIIRAMIDWRE